MHVEIQVALNFLISFLYNKLPRRRVNQFGEELENALKAKFEGHWYPEKPSKGSAYRCIRCTPPLDPLVFEVPARSSGINLLDIQENLPQELSIWVDPGEVSYRISEKGAVKILFSEKSEVKKSPTETVSGLNPEAQCFKPIESFNNQPQMDSFLANGTPQSNVTNFPAQFNSYLANKKSNPVTFTTAAFAATKFGSTKLKSHSKKSQRASPTDFSNYIKQKSIIQQAKSKNYGHNVNQDAFNMNQIQTYPTRINNTTSNDSLDFGWKSNCSPKNVWETLSVGQNICKNNLSPNKHEFTQKETGIPSSKADLLGYETNDPLQGLFMQMTNGKKSNQSFFDANLNEENASNFLSEKLWDEILNFNTDDILIEPIGVSQHVNIPNNCNTKTDPDNGLYFTSFPMSSVSSPSWSSNESSSLNLVNEFDNLSLNSNSSSSVGSVSSFAN